MPVKEQIIALTLALRYFVVLNVFLVCSCDNEPLSCRSVFV